LVLKMSRSAVVAKTFPRIVIFFARQLRMKSAVMRSRLPLSIFCAIVSARLSGYWLLRA
jgi:hypothetical protein